MKKLLSIFLAALLLPFATGAVDLQPNQLLMGHYTSDALASSGWGSNALDSLATVATDITPDELALYKGGDIVAFRVGLFLSTPVSRLFIIPVTPEGNLLMNEMTEWSCNASAQGWNMIELETPYTINVPEGYSLRIGFDYVQANKSAKPLSIVKEGVTYPTYHLVDGQWKKLVLSTKGNLSLQCVVENENFPQYVIRVRNIQHEKIAIRGTDINYSFETFNMGTTSIPAGSCSYEVAVDGTVINTLTNPVALTNQPITLQGVISTDNLPAGGHTLTITPVAVGGETIENPTVFTSTFATYDHGFNRQMRLVEQFTSTNCTYCPAGTSNIANLTNMRDDIAWVAIHEYMSGADPFMTNQTDSIDDLQGIDGYPEGTFDRSVGLQSATKVYAVLTSLPASTMSSFLDYVESQGPSWATVYINSTFDESNRKAVVTVNGDLVPGFEGFMGEDAKLTVYITEDGLVAPQVSGGNDYVHNNVMRLALGSVLGVNLNKTGDTYKNTFNVNIPSDWNADKLNIVAFISRPLGNALTDIYVTNANKRKFGESDEPATIMGDVNNDGNVAIDDVTVLINCLLQGTDPANPDGSDINGDGRFTIDDVTKLITFLLSGEWPE